MTDPRGQIDNWLHLPPGTRYSPKDTADMAGALRAVLAYADRLSEPQRTALEHAIATGAGLLQADKPTPTEPRVWRNGDPMPPTGVDVLFDAAAVGKAEPYLCRLPGDFWEWFHSPDPATWSDGMRVPQLWTDAVKEALSPLTEVLSQSSDATAGA